MQGYYAIYTWTFIRKIKSYAYCLSFGAITAYTWYICFVIMLCRLHSSRYELILYSYLEGILEILANKHHAHNTWNKTKGGVLVRRSLICEHKQEKLSLSGCCPYELPDIKSCSIGVMLCIPIIDSSVESFGRQTTFLYAQLLLVMSRIYIVCLEKISNRQADLCEFRTRATSFELFWLLGKKYLYVLSTLSRFR